MDGKAIKLLKYLDGSDKRFIIPVYQRNYSWKVENCRQLYDDLVKLIRKKMKLHFFGSLVSVYNGIQEEFLIIDGQQRVTTVSLLLLAMHNILKEKKLVAKDERLIDKIFEESAKEINNKINQGYYDLDSDVCGIKKGFNAGNGGTMIINNQNNGQSNQKYCCI